MTAEELAHRRGGATSVGVVTDASAELSLLFSNTLPSIVVVTDPITLFQ